MTKFKSKTFSHLEKSSCTDECLLNISLDRSIFSLHSPWNDVMSLKLLFVSSVIAVSSGVVLLYSWVKVHLIYHTISRQMTWWFVFFMKIWLPHLCFIWTRWTFIPICALINLNVIYLMFMKTKLHLHVISILHLVCIRTFFTFQKLFTKPR